MIVIDSVTDVAMDVVDWMLGIGRSEKNAFGKFSRRTQCCPHPALAVLDGELGIDQRLTTNS